MFTYLMSAIFKWLVTNTALSNGAIMHYLTTEELNVLESKRFQCACEPRKVVDFKIPQS